MLYTSYVALSQSPLRRIAGPQGGAILYGTVDGANTPPAAMGFILKQMHQSYGERPVVGRVFKVKGTNSDAVFFTLTPHVATMKPVAGMLIVSNAPGHVEAALLSDESWRFGKSINPMLQTLFQNWQPGGKAVQASGRGGPTAGRSEAEASGPAAPLHPFRLQDGSAMVMLAAGWQVAPQSGGGTILASGPNGEELALGFPYLAHDPRSAQTQQMMRFGQSAAGRNTAYAHNLYAPYGGDLGRTFMDLNQQASRMGAPAVGAVQVKQSRLLGPNSGAHCAIITGSTAGGEALEFEGTFCQGAPDYGGGGFMNLANLAFAPAQFAARDRATLRAMLGSFQVNQSVVNSQAYALAKPTMDAIHEIGRQVDARIAVSDQQNAEIKSSFEEHNDAMDRQSQGFSNYMLDKSVIRNTETGAHATAWNDTAATLVQSNPSHYEYVDTSNYWKGIDY
jgi:hypothetical protein